MPLSTIPKIVHEIFSSPLEDSRLIFKENKVEILRRPHGSPSRFRAVSEDVSIKRK